MSLCLAWTEVKAENIKGTACFPLCSLLSSDNRNKTDSSTPSNAAHVSLSLSLSLCVYLFVSVYVGVWRIICSFSTLHVQHEAPDASYLRLFVWLWQKITSNHTTAISFWTLLAVMHSSVGWDCFWKELLLAQLLEHDWHGIYIVKWST